MRSLARRCSASIHSWMKKGTVAHAANTIAQSGKPAIRMRESQHTSRTAHRPGKFSAIGAALTIVTISLVTSGGSAVASDLARTAVERPRYDIRVAVDVDTRTLELHVLVDLPLAYTAPVLWLYADRMRDVPPSFDEFEAERIYTGGVDRTGYGEVVVVVEGCTPQTIPPSIDALAGRSTRGRDVAIAICQDAVRPLHLDVQSTLTVARRYGPLGVARSTMTLGDPWYPLVLPSPDAEVPPYADHVVHVAPTDDRFIATASGVTGTDASHPVVFAEQRGVTHAPMVVLPNDKAIAHDGIDGVDVTLVSDSQEVGVHSAFDRDAETQLGALDVDAAGFVHGTIRDCIGLLRRRGFLASSANDGVVRGMLSTLVVVEVPSRQRLAIDVPGMLLVSDHAFRVFPIDRVRRFHAMPIARRAFEVLLSPHLRAASARADAPWVADVDGALLAEQLLSASSGGKETAADLVGFAGFHPSVDQLLYAPRVAFGAALFGIIEEPDPDRDGADRARNLVPMGHFVEEKLRDRLGARFPEAARAHLDLGQSWLDAAKGASSEDLAYFWQQWIGPHRPVAYRLASIESDGHTTTVTIERLGATWIREPVVVEVVDDDGNRARAVWDAPGRLGTVTVVTKASYRSAQLDPDRRLSQDPSLADGHPLFDDETRHAWRPPIFAHFSASYTAVEDRFDFDVNFALRRRYDLDEGYGVSVLRGPRGYGATVSYLGTFGPLLDLNRRYGAWSLGVGADRSPHGFAANDTPVIQGSLLASFGWDSVMQLQDPLTGWGAMMTASANLAKEQGGRWSPNAIVGTRAHVYFWEHVRTTSVLVAGAGLIVGNALQTQLLGVAGRQFLRAFESDEGIGKARAYAIFEQRVKLISGLYLNAAHGSWFKALELVPFAAIGGVTSQSGAFGLGARGNVLGELGMGLRLLHEWAGVQPAVLALDFAYPIVPRDRCAATDAAGSCVRARQPFGFWVGFEQTY